MMGSLLAKLFIKDYKNYTDERVRANYGKMCGAVGIVTNMLLTIMKIITGYLIGSIAIIADGINNLSDAGSSIVTLIGFKASAAPADQDHPFGHQRIEYITGLMVSFVILMIGLSLLKTSVDKIINQEELKLHWAVVIILVLSIVIKIWQSRFYKKTSRLIHSKTLEATSQDSLNDSISTFALLISFTIALITNINVDGYMGVLVSLMIIYGGYQLIRQTMSPLIGEAPNHDLVNELSADILRHKGVLGIHDMVIHSYGPAKTFMTVHVEVDSEANFIESHDIIDNIEHEFLHKYNINLVIHMDPIDTHCERTNELKAMVTEMLSEVDPILRFHDFRIVQGPTHTNLIFDVVMPMKYKKSADELVSEIKSMVKKKNQKLKAVITVDQFYLGEDVRETKPKKHRKSKETV